MLAAVVLPSPMAVKTSSSIAAFKASVRICALIVWKNSWGDGCWAAEEVDIKIPSLFFESVLIRENLWPNPTESAHVKPSQPPRQPCSRLPDDCDASLRSATALRRCAKTC